MAEIDDINRELAEIEGRLGGEETTTLPQDISLIDAELAEIETELKGRAESVNNLPPEWKDVPLEALKNIPSSSVEFAKNIYQAVRHPVQTGKALGKVGLGGIQRLIPGEQESEQSFNQMVGFFKERYGGEEALRRTISQDPIGFMTDVSAVLGGTGAIVSGVGKVSKVGAISKAGQVVSKTAVLTEPVSAIGKPIIRAGRAAKTASDSLIKTVLQFPKKVGLQRIDQLADEFIKRGTLHIDRKSLASLDVSIKNVQNKINKIVKTQTKEGILINTDDIVKSLDDLIVNADKHGLGGLDLPRNIKQIQRLRDSFLEARGQKLTPSQVQEMKVGLNKAFKPDLQTRFSQVKAKANDKLRQASMQELEKLHPQLKELNANQGVMIELRKAIENAVISLERTPSVPVKGLIAGGLAGSGVAITAGAPVGTSLIGGATFAIGSLVAGKILSSPKLQFSLARALDKANKVLAKAGKLHLVTQPTFQAGRIAREVEGNNTQVIGAPTERIPAVQ